MVLDNHLDSSLLLLLCRTHIQLLLNALGIHEQQGFDGAVRTTTFPDLDLVQLACDANSRLPATVRVRSFRWAPGVWYPARCVRGKEYVYTVCASLLHEGNGEAGSPGGDTADARFAWVLELPDRELDVSLMRPKMRRF